MNFLTRLEIFYLVGALCILIGIFANNYSRKLGIPTLLIFLVVGMLAGSDGLGGIWFDNAPLAQVIGITAMIFILFTGGLDTNAENFGSIIRPGIFLSSFGVVVSALLVSIFTMFFLKTSFWEGLLLGAIISSTDAVAVFSILRSKEIKIKENLRNLIEFESASNDPVAIFLVITILQIISQPTLSAVTFLKIFILQVAVGGLAGYIFGRFLIWVMNKVKFSNDNFYFIVSISVLLFCYGFTQIVHGSGLLAVYFAGLILGRSNFVRKKSLIIFHDTLAWLMQVVMFLVLGLLVFPKNLLNYWWQGLILSACLIFLARPLSVILCLIRSKFNFKEKLLISWGGFRGATPIVLALYPLTANMPNAELLFDLVFIIVFVSILIQAPSFPFVIKMLGLATDKGFKPRYPLGFVVTQKLKSHLKEHIVSKDSPACGKSLAQLQFPNSVRIVLIQRKHEVIAPRGTTILEMGDMLLILSTNAEFEEVKNKV